MRGLLGVVLAASLCPTLAFAEEPSSTESVIDKFAQESVEAIERFNRTGNADYLRDVDAYEGDVNDVALQQNDLPPSYDLRDEGVVTSVKNQSPWGTCWGFGAIAASETSIMSDLGWTVADGEIDLSELHTAWFAYTALPEDAGSQAGEGIHTISTDPNAILDTGGYAFTATSIFSSGVGPVSEDSAPYKNKEGITAHDQNGNPVCYAPVGDWSVDESLRFLQAFELEESSILPSPAGRDSEGGYYYNSAGTEAIKDKLMQGHAVEVSFNADTSMPGQSDPPKYINTETWAHYTYDDTAASHAVAIVGWDDAYPKDNFLEGHQPDEDGAWIVKNSWGSIEGEFPNATSEGWGEDGGGYFYLSYYDKSLVEPESFEYYTENYGEESDYYLINQYDYLPSQGVTAIEAVSPVSMANVFEAEESQLVRSLSAETASPNTTVTYQLYLLDEGYSNPQDGTLLTEFSETYQYGGYHRAQLNEGFYVAQGQHYSVVATLACDSEYEVLVDRAVNKKGMDYINETSDQNSQTYAVGVINRGESFLYDGSAWTDWVDGVVEIKKLLPLPEEADLYDYDNFPLKAYADPAENPPVSETVSVPNVGNMTEAEALSALEQFGLRGQAGEAEYSETIEAGRVIRQDIDPGMQVSKNHLVTYYLSLGKKPAPGQIGSVVNYSKDTSAKNLAATGDTVMPMAVLILVATAACVGVGVAYRKGVMRDRR